MIPTPRFQHLALVATLVVTTGAAQPATAGLTVQGRLYDGASSARALQGALDERRELEAAMKVPLANATVSVSLLPLEEPRAEAAGGARQWSVTADAEGRFQLETGLEVIPEGHALVASGLLDGRKVYSPFFVPRGGSDPASEEAVHLYPTTDSPTSIRAQLRVAYDLQREGKAHLLRVRAGLQLNNIGDAMYVGTRRGSQQRAIWRIPLPSGARITLNQGPLAGGPRWRATRDLRWLVIDAPIPGLCDVNLQGTWEVHYTIPATQSLVQKFPVPANLDSMQLALWAVDGNMEIASNQLRGPVVDQFPDPFTGKSRRFRVLFTNEPSQVATSYVAALSVDNAAIGQIAREPAIWVGSFVLFVLASVAVGLGLGRRRATAAEAVAPLEGEDVLDRIASVDSRFERGELPEKDYRLYREALLQMAASELEGEPLAPSDGTAGALPASAREILRRLDELEAAGAASPTSISERAHLLEALAKALPRENVLP